MHTMMALFDSEIRDEMFLLMELAKIKNYTHFVGLHGSSDHGKKEGSVAWPGTNEIFLLILSDIQLVEFKEVVQSYKANRKQSPGLLIFSWPLAEFM